MAARAVSMPTRESPEPPGANLGLPAGRGQSHGCAIHIAYGDTLPAVSRENIETVRRLIEAWNADDLDGFLAELDADVEWHPAIQPGLEGRASVYRGPDGAREIWRHDRGEAWERLTNRPEELRDLGESVLALGHLELTARSTGIEFSQEVGEVFDLRAGKIVRIRDFLTHAEALEAAGLSE